MSNSVLPAIRFPGYLILSALLLGIAGCADMVTYSRDAQYEGLRLYRQGAYADAAGAFRNSVRQDPRNYQSYYYLGSCYENLGQYQQAIAAYKTARQTINLTISGRDDQEFQQKILNGLASAIAASDRREVEIEQVQREAADHPSVETWFLLAKIHAIRGDADSAIDAYNHAFLLDSTNFLVAKEYGLYLERLGQTERAARPLRQAYSLNNQDAEVAAALRRIGIVPGPSLLEESQLAKPPLPKGPIPDWPPRHRDDSLPPTVQAPRD